MLSRNNVLAITYNRAERDSLDKHDGGATIRCLNVAVYTHWFNRKGVLCLEKLIDLHLTSKVLQGLTSLPK